MLNRIHSKRLSAFVVSFTFAAAMAALVQGEDWPQFRGPTGQGISSEKGLPVQWKPDQNVAWKVEIPGSGWSSPSLSRGRIYLTSAVPTEGGSGSDELALVALCLDARTGKLVWQTSVFEQGADAPKIHSKNSHASPTAIVTSDRVFVHFGHQGTACLDLQGKVVWKNNELKYPPVHGNGGSPELVDGLLIFACDGGSEPFVAAIEVSTGKVRWKFDRPGDAAKKFAFCTPLKIVVNGQQQVVIPGSDSVSSLDPKTGKEIWRVRYEGYSVIPRPVFGHDMIYLSTGYDAPTAMAIRVDGSGDVTDTHVAWTLKKGAPNTPSMLLSGTELYMISDKGVASCVDALTGEPHWQERVGGNYSASPVLADGKIYLQSEEGSGVVLKAGTTFEKIAENSVEERSLASYAVGDGAIFVRTEKHLFRVAGGNR
jgi:outer membrane protein assembly factor BamB